MFHGTSRRIKVPIAVSRPGYTAFVDFCASRSAARSSTSFHAAISMFTSEAVAISGGRFGLGPLDDLVELVVAVAVGRRTCQPQVVVEDLVRDDELEVLLHEVSGRAALAELAHAAGHVEPVVGEVVVEVHEDVMSESAGAAGLLHDGVIAAVHLVGVDVGRHAEERFLETPVLLELLLTIGVFTSVRPRHLAQGKPMTTRWGRASEM